MRYRALAGHDSLTSLHSSNAEEYFLSLEINFRSLDLLSKLVTPLQSGCRLYLFQKTSVLYRLPTEGEEGEEEPELTEEKLDTEEALERNENVDSLCFLLTGSLCCLTWELS